MNQTNNIISRVLHENEVFYVYTLNNIQVVVFFLIGTCKYLEKNLEFLKRELQTKKLFGLGIKDNSIIYF